MPGFYRLEFERGPLDGLIVEGDVLFAPRLYLPTQAEAVAGISSKAPAALYELSDKALRWEEGAPQAVLHYEFRGPQSQGKDPGRFSRWLNDRRHRLARWMMSPIDHPMSPRPE